jgi:hypothetical protein
MDLEIVEATIRCVVNLDNIRQLIVAACLQLTGHHAFALCLAASRRVDLFFEPSDTPLRLATVTHG